MTENKKTKKSLATKSKLLNAVETVLTNKGFTELKVAPICEVSNVDKKLIYFHFGDLNGLQTEFLRRQDFWQSKTEIPEEMNKENIKQILTDQFASMHENNLLKNLLIWELSEENETVKQVADNRQDKTNMIAEKFIRQNDFEMDVPPLLALIVGGLNYLSIRSSDIENPFYGIDMTKKSGRKKVVNTMRMLIENIK